MDKHNLTFGLYCYNVSLRRLYYQMFISPVEMCFLPFAGCICLTMMYVLSLYVWRDAHLMNDPGVIKKRFLSVTVTSALSPLAVSVFSRDGMALDRRTLLDLLGVRLAGLSVAATLPLFLTCILFLGPLVMRYRLTPLSLHKDSLRNLYDLIWLRDHLVAPFTEELTFRASMLPLLLECFTHYTAIFICSIFFGLAHFHHVYEKIRTGYSLKVAFLISSFQFLFTTLFGAYSGFLFLRTGHIIAPFLVHAFCNHMGFPKFQKICYYNEPKRTITALLCIFGLVTWYLVLVPFTNPKLYSNDIYWQV